MHYPLSHSFVQHLLIPLLQSFGLWDLLIGRVTVEDVVVPFTGWAGPDMTSGVAEAKQEMIKNREKKKRKMLIIFLGTGKNGTFLQEP